MSKVLLCLVLLLAGCMNRQNQTMTPTPDPVHQRLDAVEHLLSVLECQRGLYQVNGIKTDAHQVPCTEIKP